MAKYYNSIWGEIHGKVGLAVGYTYRGIPVLRSWHPPNKLHPATLAYARQAELGHIDKSSVSVEGIDMQRAVFGSFLYWAYQNMDSIILPLWGNLSKGKCLSAINLFAKYNLSSLYDSIPEKDNFYGPHNAPDLMRLLLSPHPLPHVIVHSAIYDAPSGNLTVRWSPLSDISQDVHLVVIHWALPSSSGWVPHPCPWVTQKTWGSALFSFGKIGDNELTFKIDKHLELCSNFVVYLFFSHQSKYTGAIPVRVGLNEP